MKQTILRIRLQKKKVLQQKVHQKATVQVVSVPRQSAITCLQLTRIEIESSMMVNRWVVVQEEFTYIEA